MSGAGAAAMRRASTGHRGPGGPGGPGGQRDTMAPSLSSICIGVLAAHFDAIEDAGCLTAEHYAAILRHPAGAVTSGSVARFERHNPHLAASLASEPFWRSRKECVAAEQRGYAPYPELARRLAPLQASLQAAYDGNSAAPQKTLDCLANLAIPLRLLSATKIGVLLSKYLKQRPNPKAKVTLEKWKRLASAQLDGAEDTDEAVILEGLHHCETWRGLYDLVHRCDAQKRQRFAARAKIMYTAASQAKHATQLIDNSRQKRGRPEPEPPQFPTVVSNVSRAPRHALTTSATPPPAPQHRQSRTTRIDGHPPPSSSGRVSLKSFRTLKSTSKHPRSR